MSKPLHKDPSFWIVAVTLLAAADVAQLKYGVPWFREKLASMKPAPRAEMTAQAPLGFAQIMRSPSGIVQQPQNPPHAPGEWRLPYHEPNIFQTASNAVALLPTKFETPEGSWTPENPPVGGWGTRQQDKAIGIRMPSEFVIQTAYNWNSRSRILFQDRPPSGQFDFIANLPTGGFDALQKEIKNQWGIVAERKTFQTNALVLLVSRADVLKPRAPGAAGQSRNYSINFGSIQSMVSFFENVLNKPILDQTSLTGIYELPFPTEIINSPSMPGFGGTDERPARIRKYIEDQFGLNLVETNTAIEMLVVSKVGEPMQAGAKGNGL